MTAEATLLKEIEVETASFDGRSLSLLTIELRRGHSRLLVPKLIAQDIAPGVYAPEALAPGLQFEMQGHEVQIVFRPQS